MSGVGDGMVATADPGAGASSAYCSRTPNGWAVLRRAVGPGCGGCATPNLHNFQVLQVSVVRMESRVYSCICRLRMCVVMEGCYDGLRLRAGEHARPGSGRSGGR